MSESMAAEIWIGGQIPKRLAPQLCRAIRNQGASLDWGDAHFSPANAADLLEGCLDGEILLLHLCEDYARWGEFQELEAFLVQRKISFRRWTEAKAGYDAELVEFRPGTGLVQHPTDSSGRPFVPLADLAAIARALDQAVDSAGGKSAGQLLTRLRSARRLVKKSLPIVVPPLEPFEIVGAKTIQETHHG